jgi:predicted ester cyclase
MTAEENKKIFMEWLKIFNSGDIHALEILIDETTAPDLVNHNPSFPDLYHDREGSKKWHRKLLNDFPDCQVVAEDIIAENDKVACYGMITGTNASTGELLKMQFMHVSRYFEGKVVEEWEMDVPMPVKTKVTI